jgi:hypothetical protein
MNIARKRHDRRSGPIANDGLANDVPGCVAGQVNCHVGDILRYTDEFSGNTTPSRFDLKILPAMVR